MTDEQPPPSLLRKILKIASIAAGVAIAMVVALLLIRPEALLFRPSPRRVTETPAALGLSFERVEIQTADDETVVGWYLRGDPNGALADEDAVVLYCHGNAGNIGGRVHLLPALRSLGVDILMWDYRGYGDSSGRPTVAGTRLDVEAVWEHLVERGYPEDHIILWGRSLGGAVAIDQAARASAAGTPPRALIVESSFTSTLDLGAELYPWLPVRVLGGKLDYPSAERIATVTAPVLVAHSPDDDLIPPSHGQALFDAAASGRASKANFVELRGGHNDGHLADSEKHLSAIVALLRY